MARPVNANAAQTRRTILKAATKLFAERGETGASVRAVARASGVSLATVHHYFGSKDALYRACVDAMDEEFTELQAELARVAREGAHGSIDEVIEAVVRRAYRFAREHVLAVRLTTRDAVERGEMPANRQLGMLVPGLSEGVALLGQMTGAPPTALRLTLRSLSFLVVRYAVSTTRELAMVMGLDPEDYDAAACQQAVEDHLVFSARALMTALVAGDA